MAASKEDGEPVQSDIPSTEALSADSADARKSKGWLLLLGVGVVVVVGAVGLLGWRVALESGWSQQPRTVQGEDSDKHRQTPAPSSSPAPASQPAPPEPPLIAPDLPPPETVEELLEEAQQTADRLVRCFPDNPDAFEVKARIHYYVGDYPAAIECWEQCLKRQPQYAYAHHGLGLVAAKKADYEEAAAHQRKAFELAPGLTDVAVELADTLMKLGKLDEAIEVLEKHLDVNPRAARAHLALGHAYLQAKEYGKAEAAYRGALKLHAEMPRAQFGLATALARLGQTEESRRAMERYKELEAKKIELRRNLRSQFDDLGAVCVDIARNFTHAARICLVHRELADAERLCRRAATLDPNNTECRILLASLYLDGGRKLAEAAQLAQEAARIQPTAPNYCLLGQAHAAAGDRAQAVAAFQKAVDLDPANQQYREVLRQLRESE